MDALRVTVKGEITSFRYPHFVQGVHPTFEMPPPATIYGHVCSAVGDLLPRDTTHFAYHFRFETRFFDYEHLHFFGKDPKMNPFERELLFKPELTLYLSNTALEGYFRHPRYPVVLGRSQDLMTYTEVKVVALQPVARAFFSGTLLTLLDAARVGGRSYAVTMPRFIDERRQPEWAQYGVLPHTPQPPVYPNSEDLQFSADSPLWVDTDYEHPYERGIHRGVVWHNWLP